MALTANSPEPVVTADAPITSDRRFPTPSSAPPDVVRCAYMDLVVTDLQRSRDFYVNVLGLVVTEEDEEAVYLRSLEEFIHHNLVLRKGPAAAAAAFSYRVRTPEDLDRAVAFFEELGCRVERRAEGYTKGIGDSVRVEDPLGFPYEFFYDVQHVERLAWRYDLYTPGALVRLDHFNQVTPDVPRAVAYMEDLGFRVTEDIQDEEGTTYAAWMRRKPTVHDTATCATRTGTASRSTRRTTTPATPTTQSSPGTSMTTSAATGGATPSSRPGTPRPRSCSTSTASRNRWCRGPTPARWL